MVEIIPYKAEHLMAIAASEARQFLAKNLSYAQAKAFEDTDAFTAMDGDTPIGCGGVVDHWPGRAEVWSYLSGDVTPRSFVRIHKAAKRHLDARAVERLEVYVDCLAPNGGRWARALGFYLESARVRKYWPDGRDAAHFVRIR